MTKVYLAAMYQWMDKMKVEREKFRAAGFEVTSQWIDGDEEKQLSRHGAAAMDLADVESADVFVIYTLDKGTMFSSGGRFVELGYAMAQQKSIYIVGDRENVFCHHDDVTQCGSTEEVIKRLSIHIDRTLTGHVLRVKITPEMNESDILNLITGHVDPVLKKLRE